MDARRSYLHASLKLAQVLLQRQALLRYFLRNIYADVTDMPRLVRVTG